jgi:hypothetical protein
VRKLAAVEKEEAEEIDFLGA